VSTQRYSELENLLANLKEKNLNQEQSDLVINSKSVILDPLILPKRALLKKLIEKSTTKFDPEKEILDYKNTSLVKTQERKSNHQFSGKIIGKSNRLGNLSKSLNLEKNDYQVLESILDKNTMELDLPKNHQKPSI